MGERKDFCPAFLSGFYADISDVSEKVYENDAKAKVWEENLRKIHQTPQFAACGMKTAGAGVRIPEVKVHMVEETMFPVWFMSYRKKDRVIYATVNGQTGKVVADLPIDPIKYLIGSLILTVPIFLLLNWFLVLTPTALTVIMTALGLLTLFLYGLESSQIAKRSSLKEDRGRNWANHQKNTKAGQNPKPVLHTDFDKPKITGYFGALFAVGISVLLLVVRPVSDLYYYAGAILSFLMICLTMISIIQAYNVLSTHRLPQFDKQGGDDRA